MLEVVMSSLDTVSAERVQAVRGFNRFYTNVIGVLGEGLLDTPYSLTESRVLFELAARSTCEVAGLRRTLDLDGGYLSRILARFDADGLITRERAADDARRQVVRLTGRGHEVFATLDDRSADQIAALLGRFTDDDQRRLVGAMEVIEGIVEGSAKADSFVLRPFGPGDYGWVIQRHGALYAAEYGWDSTFEALVARIVADYADGHDAGLENAWIAEVAGAPVGCVFCVRDAEEGVARLRLLLVEPGARGMGVGGRLVEECLRFARRAGYQSMVLWTNDVLVSARHIYQRAGFTLADEGAHHAFGHDLVEQTWRLTL
jgi:DNA-binding MarR family transcriptional regulator/GNAT superfamily N-acetyltransferase